LAATILLIEDDALIAGAMSSFLESRAFACRRAGDGEDGLRLAREGKPSLILLDLMLPGIDGFEVCRRLRASPETGKTPIVVVTSLAKMAEVEKAYALGADDYLIKPFENERLLQKIERLLEGQGR
jgi:DNA-binding response OmpR family regulator